MKRVALLVSGALSRTRGRVSAASVLARATLALGATACIALAVQTPEHAPLAKLQLVDGTLSVSNSNAGAAILSAHDMKPGDATEGRVTIANTGTVPGDFTLATTGLIDVPGSGGGMLSAALQATVRDVTDPSTPQTVYSGPLGAMPARPLGGFAAGEQRSYSFSVSLPTAAPGLNSVQGAGVTVGYSWTATDPGDGQGQPPADPGTPPTDPGTPPADPVTPPVTPPEQPATPPALKLGGPKRWSARKRGNPAITATCARTCTIAASIRTLGLARGLKLRVRSNTPRSAPLRSRRFTILLSPKARRSMRDSAKRLRYAAIVVRVTASDASGLRTTRTRTIRVTR